MILSTELQASVKQHIKYTQCGFIGVCVVVRPPHID